MSSREKHKQKKRRQREVKARRIRDHHREKKIILHQARKTGGLVKTVDHATRLAFQQTLIEQRAAFEEKFGRVCTEHDPIFFDPDGPDDEPVSWPREKIQEHLESLGRLDVYRKLAEEWRKAEAEIEEKRKRIKAEHRKEKAKRSLVALRDQNRAASEAEKSDHVVAEEG